MKRSLFGVSVVALSLATAAGFMATPANAVAPVQSCAHLTASASFKPGLTFTPANQTITAKGTVTGCTKATATGGSGTLTATIKIAGGSCAKLAAGGQKLTGTGKTVWKNKKTSSYAMTFTTGKGNSITVATITGKVSAGLFVGKHVAGTVKFQILGSPTPDCSAAHPIKNIKVANTKPFVIS